MSQVVLEYEFDTDQALALSEAYLIGHQNFYENYCSREELAAMMDRVEEVLPDLIELTTMPPRPFTINSRVQLRRLRRLTGNESLEIGDASDVGFSLKPGGTSVAGEE